MSSASSLRASSARTIGKASRAGSRFAEQASWLRTSTSGSIAARRASAAATDGETCDSIAQESRRPEPHVGIGMLERLQGRRFVQPADQVQGPERLEGESGRVSSSSTIASSSGAIDASLRSPISRRAVCRVHLLGSARRLTSSGVLRRRQIDGLDGSAGSSRLEPVDPPAAPGRSVPRGCGSG